MTHSRRFPYQIFTGLAVALLLLTSNTNGVITAGLAATLLVIGLVLYPEMRRTAIIAAAIAAGVAIVIAFARGLF